MMVKLSAAMAILLVWDYRFLNVSPPGKGGKKAELDLKHEPMRTVSRG
jgi:hypothetical protein